MKQYENLQLSGVDNLSRRPAVFERKSLYDRIPDQQYVSIRPFFLPFSQGGYINLSGRRLDCLRFCRNPVKLGGRRVQ